MSEPTNLPPGAAVQSPSLTELVTRAKSGDQAALDELFRLHYPILRRLAHRRLSDRSRRDKDTDDVVQITLLRAMRGLKDFESRWENAWLSYLRQILFNYLRDEGRRAGRLPEVEEFDGDMPGTTASPLDRIVEAETLSAYQAALARLPDRQRQAVVLRIEQGLGYAEIGERLGLPTGGAARMMVKRSIARLAGMIDQRK